jgi:hypothetical protein
MKAGTLKDRITLQKQTPSGGDDSWGQPSEWIDEARVWASIEAEAGTEASHNFHVAEESYVAIWHRYLAAAEKNRELFESHGVGLIVVRPKSAAIVFRSKDLIFRVARSHKATFYQRLVGGYRLEGLPRSACFRGERFGREDQRPTYGYHPRCSRCALNDKTSDRPADRDDSQREAGAYVRLHLDR